MLPAFENGTIQLSTICLSKICRLYVTREEGDKIWVNQLKIVLASENHVVWVKKPTQEAGPTLIGIRELTCHNLMLAYFFLAYIQKFWNIQIKQSLLGSYGYKIFSLQIILDFITKFFQINCYINFVPKIL